LEDKSGFPRKAAMNLFYCPKPSVLSNISHLNLSNLTLSFGWLSSPKNSLSPPSHFSIRATSQNYGDRL
ncbi:hypothetical protein, partial [Vibrio sp. 10N.247.310.17]|uniref:hypothetical protein n=1 Tax=Vibrio sp. 10N.247.310.17 TaxID=3229979 RepID=UPI00355270DA